MSARPRFVLTPTVERDRSAAVMRCLRQLPTATLIQAATALMRVHPDLAGPFAAAALAGVLRPEDGR
jgi:hypothetical protein